MHFGHMVYFKLKDNSDESAEQLVNSCQEFLASHEGIVYFSAGTLAETDRSVNVRDFDVALHLVFENRLAHDEYQVSERHEQFIAANQQNWDHVRVFDANVKC